MMGMPMLRNRICYLLAMLAAFIFYMMSGAWFSWILLLTVLGLPWLSLVLSLPAMVTTRLEAEGPEHVCIHDPAQVWLKGSSFLPTPPYRGRLRLKHCFTGDMHCCPSAAKLPTEHCGGWEITVDRARICDYLGIFSFPVRPHGSRTVLVRPDLRELSRVPEMPEMTEYDGTAFGWLPGIPAVQDGSRSRIPVVMTLQGTDEELDRKLGRLLWLGDYFLKNERPFELRVLTDEGIRTFAVTTDQELKHTVDRLLRSGACPEGDIRGQGYMDPHLCYIGGEPNAY